MIKPNLKKDSIAENYVQDVVASMVTQWKKHVKSVVITLTLILENGANLGAFVGPLHKRLRINSLLRLSIKHFTIKLF